MEIDLQTKIGDLLDAYPHLEDTLLALSPAFAKLRNPVLRRTVAKVATVRQAAKTAGISPVEMVQTLRKAAGLTVNTDYYGEDNNIGEIEDMRPEWLDESGIAIRFDAGRLIESGQSPLADVVRLSKELKAGDIMEVAVPFKPQPLMDRLSFDGFDSCYMDGKAYFKKK